MYSYVVPAFAQPSGTVIDLPEEKSVPPRKSPAQIQAELRRIQQKQRQAIVKHNRAVDDYNRAARKAVSDHNANVRKANQAINQYNSAARSHNAKVRANRDRLRRELNRLSAGQRSQTVRVTYRASVQHLTTSFDALERHASAEGWEDSDVIAYTSAEAANSVAALNALLDETGTKEATDAEISELQATSIASDLENLDADLAARWRGALFALSPRNPDAARHFCTSAREMLSDILSHVAPTERVLQDDPDCDRTPEGKITRRSRIRFCLRRSGLLVDHLEEFIERDMDNVLALFAEFNSGTHGAAGQFSLLQLRTLKLRVEDAVSFVLRIAA